MFKQIITSIGIGDAKIDTKLNKKEYHIGEQIQGIIVFENLEGLHIDHIELTLFESFKNNDETSEFSTIDEPIAHMTLQPKHGETISFEMDTNKVNLKDDRQYFIKTHVFVDNAVDYYDEDEIIFI